jgi:hypothetical protein
MRGRGVNLLAQTETMSCVRVTIVGMETQLYLPFMLFLVYMFLILM